MASADEIMERRTWWRHPKIKNHYRFILGSLILFVIGSLLLAYGLWAMVEPDSDTNPWVFITLGMLSFIPGQLLTGEPKWHLVSGAYHTGIISLALCGKRGYQLENVHG